MKVAYNRQAAVEYAKKWANKRNPMYYDFEDIGGDCTNFASQCIYAGAGVMNYKPEYGWYYINTNNRTASWTGVEYLYNFLINNKENGPFAEEVSQNELEMGDIIQLGTENGKFYHSLVVIRKMPILIAAHTMDAFMRPLATYDYGAIRCLHILGAIK